VFITRYNLFFRRSGGVRQEKSVFLSVDPAVFIMRYHCVHQEIRLSSEDITVFIRDPYIIRRYTVDLLIRRYGCVY
jgi:hypothetical protein